MLNIHCSIDDANIVYQASIVSGRLGLIGRSIIFNYEPLFSLNVGDKVTQIGDGRENGCARTDNFNCPLMYVGTVSCQFSKVEKMYAFCVGEKTTEGNVYLLYGSTGKELFTEDTYSKVSKLSYVRFYSPLFVLSS